MSVFFRIFGGDFHGRFLIYSLDLCTLNGYYTPLIKSFADKETEKVYNQVSPGSFLTIFSEWHCEN